MKKLITILFLLLLFGGGASGSWWYFLRPTEVRASVAVASQYTPIELDTIPIARIRSGRAETLFNFQIVLLIDSEEKANAVRAVLPDVIDSIIVELHGLMSRKIMEQNGYDPELIRNRLTKAVDRRIGAGWIDRVSIRNMERVELR